VVATPGKGLNPMSSTEKKTYSIVRPFQSFFRKEAFSSLLLIVTAGIAFTWSNSPFAEIYHRIWQTTFGLSLGAFAIRQSLLHWINDGLMAVFFFTLGLEIKREMLVGELASFRKAFLPAAAGLGGMLVPASIYFLFNHGTSSLRGWGIPMATDIAFALGAIALLGRSVPLSLRIFLAALSITDDIGAVLVIALFYTQHFVLKFLALSLILILGLFLLNLLRIRWILPYAILGILLWFSVQSSGLHATIAGIVTALFIPARGRTNTDKFLLETRHLIDHFQCPPEGCGDSILINPEHQNTVQSIKLACQHVETPLQRFEHALTPIVTYLVIPLFALANVGFTLSGIHYAEMLRSSITMGIVCGLVIGKPLGITLFSYAAVKTGLAELPSRLNWSHIIGVGFLGGIGFTMSLFISLLSFSTESRLASAKLGILLGSILSSAIGLILLTLLAWKKSQDNQSVRKTGKGQIGVSL